MLTFWPFLLPSISSAISPPSVGLVMSSKRSAPQARHAGLVGRAAGADRRFSPVPVCVSRRSVVTK
jgi:hypothetical protein